MRLLLTLTILGALATPASANPREPEARQLFFSARAMAKRGDHAGAVKALMRVKRIMGPNQRIMPMLVTSLRHIRDYIKAHEELRRYFRLRPPPNPQLAEYEDMRKLRPALERQASQQRNEFNQARGTALTLMQRFVREYPHSHLTPIVRRRIRGARARLARLADDRAFARARQTNTIAAYQAYMRSHTRHRGAARTEIRRIRAQQKEADRQTAARRLAKRHSRARWHLDMARREDAKARSLRNSGLLRIGIGVPSTVGGIGGLAYGIAKGETTIAVLGGVLIVPGIVLLATSNKPMRRSKWAKKRARSHRSRARSLGVPTSLQLVPTIDQGGRPGLALLGRF